MAQVNTNWLVAVDDSDYSSWAFNYAISGLDRENDHLFIFNVHDIPSTVYGEYADSEIIRRVSDIEELRSKKILVHYGRKAQALGINYTMMKGVSSHPADLICRAIKERNIHHLVTGRREMGNFKRFFLGSTSTYLVEHAHCNVTVIKAPYGPEEEHSDKLQAILAEETERIRRIEEDEHEMRELEAERIVNLQKVKEEEERARQERIADDSKFTPARVDQLFHIFAFQEDIKNLTKVE